MQACSGQLEHHARPYCTSLTPPPEFLSDIGNPFENSSHEASNFRKNLLFELFMRAGKRFSLTIISGLCILLCSASAHTAGFDDGFAVHAGHYDSDGQQDLFVTSQRSSVLIPVDDIPIVVPPPVADFVLRNNGNGTFSVVNGLSGPQRSSFRAWPVADVGVAIRDVDVNGSDDLTLEGVSTVAPGAFDQIVYAARNRGVAPIHVTVQDAKFERYHRDLVRWMLDPQYFQNVPLKVQSVQSSAAVWYAFVSDPLDFATLFFYVERCRVRNPGYVCGYTNLDPVPNSADPGSCIRSVALTDQNNQPLGTDPNHNVCQYSAHVYVYVPSQVVLAADTSIYDTDAKETADILRRLREECVDVPINDPQSARRLEEILARVYGSRIFVDHAGGLVNINNSVSHPPFPGDGAFDPSHDTYHHYDVSTKICNVGSVGCDTSNLRELLRYFSYPSYKLQPTLTAVNGTDRVLVRITLVPGNNPDYYITWGGYVTQRFVESGYWQGAIQNITTSTHIVYPGTISRTITQSGNALGIFTHGVGINRAFCSVYEAPLNMPLQMILGFSNDVFGAAAFRALDRQLKRQFQQNPLGRPQGTTGANKPLFDAIVAPAGERT